MATCPNGHDSATADYCDTCGTPIEAPPDPTLTVPAVEPEAPASPATTPCPSCGEPLRGRFCESCGYDPQTGQAAAPAALPAGSTVTLEVDADRALWDRMVGSGEPAFPATLPALRFELTGDRATLGRIRTGAPVDVELPLTGASADPAISHNHCVFERQGDRWTVRDAGSANGTWINDAARPLAPGQTHTLAEGDRILLGAWTRLTVHIG
jgi:FHA domain-containing protein